MNFEPIKYRRPWKTYLTTPEPARRAHRPPSAVGGRGSMTSLVSGTSMASRKKKPAPPPPPSSLGVVSPIPPPVSPRTKKRPPPSPRVSTPSTHPSSGASPTTPTTPSKPPSNSLKSSTQNVQPSNSSVKTSPVHRSNSSLNTENTPSGGATSTPAGFTPHKSTYGQWRRKKGHAPPVPIPQRRTIAPMSMENVKRELADIEIKQQELERQGENSKLSLELINKEVLCFLETEVGVSEWCEIVPEFCLTSQFSAPINLRTSSHLIGPLY
ncbi:hypothetical protein M8J77_021419 [Diaphorina citri]|nr:hypothetical protein M8J77_021419 [Diaphorina citri]